MKDVELRDDLEPIPYIARGKCLQCIKPEMDNGRILSAESLDLWITEIDLSIINKQYRFKYKVLDLFTASKRKLPKAYTDLLFSMYEKKTKLKGSGDDYSYNKYKSQVNSVYGLTVQNPCKEHYQFKDGLIEINESEDMSSLIDRYQRKGWLPYQWGVW